ncbi:hypothetical protein DFJ73DRAFT_911712, partial [Zopfochytrium polystomum]
ILFRPHRTSASRFLPKASSSRAQPSPLDRSCVTCTENYPPQRLSKMPCAHEYCTGCVSSLAKKSLRDRDLVPLRCCKQEIPDALFLHVFTQTERATYERFLNEWRSPPAPAAAAGAHDEQMAALAAQHGWKRCPSCGFVIEKHTGCVHMTCKCRHEFCYTCLETWHSCTCELIPPAELERILDDRLRPDERRNEAVRQTLREAIRTRYDGHQHRWGYRSGSTKCGTCGWLMPQFYFECSWCREYSCSRCRFNR